MGPAWQTPSMESGRCFADSVDNVGWWIFTRIVLPGLAVLTLVFGGLDIGSAWGAAHGRGTHGTFHAEVKNCAFRPHTGTHCGGFYGSFVSDDRPIRLPLV